MATNKVTFLFETQNKNVIEKDLKDIQVDAKKTGDTVDREISDGFQDAEKTANRETEQMEQDLKGVQKESKKTGGVVSSIGGSFKSAGSSASNAIGGITSSMKAIPSAALGMAAAGVAACVAVSKAAIATADKIDGLAEGMMGIGMDPAVVNESMSGLIGIAGAAAIAGTSMQELGKANVKWGKSALSAQNPTSKQAQALDYLGLSAYNADGSVKSFTQIMQELPSALETVGYGTATTTAMFVLFGGAAKGVFKLVAFGVPQFKALATSISSTISPEDIKAFVDLQSAIDKVLIQGKMLFFQALVPIAKILTPIIELISGLIETITPLIQAIVEWANQSVILQWILASIEITVTAISGAISIIVGWITSVVERFNAWAEESKLLQAILQGIEMAVTGITNAIQTMINWINQAIASFQNFRAQDFGSDLINIGAGAAGSSASSQMTQALNASLSGINSSTTANINLSQPIYINGNYAGNADFNRTLNMQFGV